MTVKALKTNNMAFKMKGSPMQRNFGIGASPVNKKGKATLIDKTKKDVTEEYKKKGNKETRDAIAAGAKVVKDADGKIRIEKPAPTQMGLKHFTTKERIH
jgi:hypothetical protein